MSTAVVDEAIKKASIVWVSVGGGAARGLWCMPLDGALIVVTGPGEQELPGLAEAVVAEVRLRGDTGGLIVIAGVAVERVTPESEEWDAVALPLANKRLNASGSAEEMVARWAATGCAVVRLRPAGEGAVTRPGLPDGDQAAVPRETPARVEVRRPFRLHRVRKRR